MRGTAVLEAARIVFVTAWATLLAGGITLSRCAAVRQHRGAVFSSSSTIGQMLKSPVTTWWVAVIAVLFALAGVLYGLSRLT
jgi:hypothetical protein